MRYWVGVIGMCVMAAATPAACMAANSSAESGGPLAFAAPEALSTTCAALAKEPVKVRVRNETSMSQNVRVLPELLEDESKEAVDLTEVCGGLEVLPKEAILTAAAGLTITLKADNGASTDAFTGSLAVYSDSGGVARREVEITSKPTAVGALEATPLVSDVKVHTGTGDGHSLWVPVAGSNEELPSAPKDAEGDEALTVGALTGPGDLVAVTYGGESEPLGEEAAKVKLDLDGDLSPGTYSGEVDLFPEAEGGELTLEVSVSRSVIWAVLALLLGIGIGIGILRTSGRRLPRARLLGEVEDLSRRYVTAKQAVDKAAKEAARKAGKERPWRDFEIDDLENLKQGLRDKITETTEASKVLVQIEKSVIESNAAAIKTAAAQIDLLKEIPKHAIGLEAALELPRAELPRPGEDDAQTQKPALDKEADKLLKGEAIKAEDLKPRLDAMDACAGRLKTLRKHEKRMQELWLDLEGLSEAPREKLHPIAISLEECRRQLWRAEDEEALKEAGDLLLDTAGEILKLTSEVSSSKVVMEMLEERGAPEPFAREETGRLFALATGFDRVGGLGPLGDGRVVTMATTAAPAADPHRFPQLSEADAQEAIDKAMNAQIVVVIASLLVAIASGLGALYAGKAWGSGWDILAAVVWGAAGQVLVTTLVSYLDGIGALAALRRP